jgi:hypothetical protein
MDDANFNSRKTGPETLLFWKSIIVNRMEEWENLLSCLFYRICEKIEIFLHVKNGLYVHLYRSLHRRSDFSVKKGAELLQDLVATETFNNLQKLSNMRRLTALRLLFMFSFGWA